jgi:SAM-dependent methyltransferase
MTLSIDSPTATTTSSLTSALSLLRLRLHRGLVANCSIGVVPYAYPRFIYSTLLLPTYRPMSDTTSAATTPSATTAAQVDVAPVVAATPAPAKQESQRQRKKKAREAAAAAVTNNSSNGGVARSDDGASALKWPRRGSSAAEHGRATSEMSVETHTCPLCSSRESSYWSYAGSKNYWRCHICSLVFMLQRHRLNAVDEKARYDHHQNRPDDDGYRGFLSRVVKPLVPMLQHMLHDINGAKPIEWPQMDDNGTLPPPAPSPTAVVEHKTAASSPSAETKTEEKPATTVTDSSSSNGSSNVSLCGLDFGCGPGPTLCLLINEAMPKGSVTISNFDIFYHNDQSLLTPVGDPIISSSTSSSSDTKSTPSIASGYDFITCTETAEHFFTPLTELTTMNRALKPGGLLALMTEYIPVRQDRFSGWSYIRDPTHVVLFSPATMKWIADHFGWQLMYIDHKSIVIFRKPLSPLSVPSST